MGVQCATTLRLNHAKVGLDVTKESVKCFAIHLLGSHTEYMFDKGIHVVHEEASGNHVIAQPALFSADCMGRTAKFASKSTSTDVMPVYWAMTNDSPTFGVKANARRRHCARSASLPQITPPLSSTVLRNLLAVEEMSSFDVVRPWRRSSFCWRASINESSVIALKGSNKAGLRLHFSATYYLTFNNDSFCVRIVELGDSAYTIALHVYIISVNTGIILLTNQALRYDFHYEIRAVHHYILVNKIVLAIESEQVFDNATPDEMHLPYPSLLLCR
ncbi:uncharacterized protein PITG_19189 [Phytophthora infestans T30-4]|uniref:Uncharacterized protein n=1 Tax=Phytophthora infestans (strain T30-4) TaxID=403677 RepID=D0NZJ5_PHYIT|nr:uncharacterized protein PITG_19189 [Phytophthora infestans T30-4]EEY69552.1 hypothetical protein PITG_19189 [Phytophthora infestans T30-4]|eukprot:XP_002997229.1 hypothetical protein PITG_19189 [Phytophthora infestans T30-4]